jgi:hypothetical protein
VEVKAIDTDHGDLRLLAGDRLNDIAYDATDTRRPNLSGRVDRTDRN